MTIKLRNLSLAALRSAYDKQQLTPRQLWQDIQHQADAQAGYKSWIYRLSDTEIEVYLTRLESSDREQLPLYGVPFAIKDNIDLAGVPTTAACPEFSYIPEHSAPVVQALIDAGALPIGKTNLDQFATGLVGTRSPFGEGKNAFNPEYISGGSSAGSATATALGQVSFALGTDTAGSGRVPAAVNNLIGHKPTRGLLSTRGVVPACRTLDCVSIFTLNCEDAAILCDIAGQYDEDDAYARPNHYANRARYFRAAAKQAFRFGVPASLDFQGNAETKALFARSVAQLQALGGEAVSIDFEPFLDAAKLLYEGPWVAERWLATESVESSTMLPVIAEIVSGAEGATAADAFAAQYKLATLKKICDRAMADLDFVVTPTTPTVFTRAEIAEAPIVNNSILGTYTNFMNLLDYSATAVPVGFLECGITWGVTLFGQAFEDIKLLSYAQRLHRSLALPLAATGLPTEFEDRDEMSAAVPAPMNTVDVVVCGAHLEGQPLNFQLLDRGAVLQRLCHSSANYQLYALPDGKRPAMVRNESTGCAIAVEVWRVPAANFGSFVAGIPAPLGIGKVELEDGCWLSGFICESAGLEGARDISAYGSWLKWLSNR